MQRIRISLPYFKKFQWDPEVVYIHERYADMVKDELLLQSIPKEIKTHPVKAFNKKITAQFGLGSIALRSLWFYRRKVNSLLKTQKYDLIYFSTTQFPVCILGAYWKKRFNIPYVIDMQDPWHSDYYQDKPKQQQPNKYWFSYHLNKYLEPISIKKAGGLISVSEDYIDELKVRYPVIKCIPAATITFGASVKDNEIAANNEHHFCNLLTPGFKNIVYVGRGGTDMHDAILPLFNAIKQGMVDKPLLFKELKIYFIGTSYAPAAQGIPSIMPLAKQLGIAESVVEMTDRITYFHTLSVLKKADALFIPGSDDPRYSPSKIFPYLLSGKPVLALLNFKSPAHDIFKEYGAKYIYNYDQDKNIAVNIEKFLLNVIYGTFNKQEYEPEAIKKYSAENLTHEQCKLLNRVINEKNQKDLPLYT